VVKELKQTYHQFGETFFKTTPLLVDHTYDFGFSVNYFPPENCGSDRLVAAFAGAEKFGKPIIVCDFGTATNIEVVDQKNQYLGGVITPGPNTLGSALFEKTSKLPQVGFEKPKQVIGNSTVSSIQSGIYFGYIGLVDGIIKRIKKELTGQLQIISTGGFAEIIAQDSKYIKTIEKDLVLEGLFLLHKKRSANP
jgi:type III pantothenate kinase